MRTGPVRPRFMFHHSEDGPMAVLGTRSKLAVVTCGTAGVILSWLLLVQHESHVKLPEDVNSKAYQKIISQCLQKDSKPAQATVAAEETQPDRAPEDVNEFGSRRAQSSENLRVLVTALRQYAAVHGTLPPAIVRSKEGKALYSWRVLLLPYLDKGEELFRQFDLNEAWDGPNNKKLLARMPRVYALPQARKEVYTTHYQLLVGKHTAFEEGLELLAADLEQVANRTILLAEAGQAVPWTRPDDVNVDQGTCFPRLGGLFPEGFHVAFADGRVCFIPEKVEREFPGQLREALGPGQCEPCRPAPQRTGLRRVDRVPSQA